MKFTKFSEGGQALVIIALAAIVLFGFTALAIDGSAKLSDRRHAQNAADTAALAAAVAKVDAQAQGLSDSPTTCPAASLPYSDVCVALLDAGKHIAGINGYNNDVATNTVEVHSPPTSGYYKDNTEYVQVIITSHVNTYFMRVLGIKQSDNIVQAVAYAKPGKNLAEGSMVISYDPNPNCSTGGTGGYSVEVTGNATVNLSGGGILLNSNATCGFKIPNCADLNLIGGAGGISSVGANNIDTTGCTFDPPLTKNFNQTPIAIPDDVYWPGAPPECSVLATAYNDPPGSNTWHITPGYYADFLQTNLNGDIVGTKRDMVMDPAVYCVGKSIHWSGSTFTSLNGSSGVTIYLKNGFDFDLSINSPITLYASHSGSDYDGYLIIQEGTYTSHGSCTINGGSYLDIEGLIYAPYCNFTVNGQAGETAPINAQLIGWDIKINGSNQMNFTYDPSNLVKIKRRVGLMK